jgi:hypothetical protein
MSSFPRIGSDEFSRIRLKEDIVFCKELIEEGGKAQTGKVDDFARNLITKIYGFKTDFDSNSIKEMKRFIDGAGSSSKKTEGLSIKVCEILEQNLLQKKEVLDNPKSFVEKIEINSENSFNSLEEAAVIGEILSRL